MNSMPKIKSPFVRKLINGEYVVTDKIEPGYEWVFEDPEVLPVEKLDGMNVSVTVQGGTITTVWSRSERIIVFMKSNMHIIKGLLESCKKGYCEFEDGQYFGELIGNKKDGYVWIPFIDYCQKKLVYKTYHEYPKTFESISKWFKDDLFSLYIRRSKGAIVKPEGIVFTQPSTGKMAKLRLDMFDWYKGKRHKNANNIHSKNTCLSPPKYAKLKTNGTSLRLVTNNNTRTYYRDAGCWNVDFFEENGKYYTHAPEMQHLDKIELIKTSKQEWLKDNAGYTD